MLEVLLNFRIVTAFRRRNPTSSPEVFHSEVHHSGPIDLIWDSRREESAGRRANRLRTVVGSGYPPQGPPVVALLAVRSSNGRPLPKTRGQGWTSDGPRTEASVLTSMEFSVSIVDSPVLRIKTEFRAGPVTWSFLGIGAVGGLFLFVVLVYPSVGGLGPNHVWEGVATVAAFLAVVEFVTLGTHPAWSVEIGPQAVTFGYPLRKCRVQWRDLQPVPEPVWREWWIFIAPSGWNLFFMTRTHYITESEARAVLAYPACPKYKLPPRATAALTRPSSGTLPRW